jgi:phosphomannomutase/phosphoglucomutase
VGRELSTEVATSLGWALADMALEKGVATVYVAHDPRASSPNLYDVLCNGMAEIGMRVVELDMAPAALLYFAMHKDPETAAVLVTGSHNPPEYNGFKLYLRTEPIHGAQLQDLLARMSRGGFEPGSGSRERGDLRQEYLGAVVQEVSLTRPLKVVIDGGNGAAGELACEALEMLGCEVVPLYCDPDGSFPHHHPDPSRAENLLDLQREVLAKGADLGVAFDGDGDRIGGVDDQGEIIRPEHMLMLLAADILRRHPGSDVVYDVKSSRHLASFVLAQGGRPIMWRSGHTRMKEKMRETGALLGGEFAGHFYIKERWYGSDDAIYVAARLLEVIADDPRPVSEQMAELPRSPATPEYQLSVAEGESAGLMQALEGLVDFPDARTVDLDGLRVEFPQSWGLVRASNTLPSLTFRFEAENEAELEAVKQRFRELLAQVVPGETVPF